MPVANLLNAVSANTTGPVVGFGSVYGNLTLVVSTSGTVSAFSVQLSGSNDSATWESIGSAVTSTTAGTSVGTGILFQYFQASLSGYSGTGTVTVELAYSLEGSTGGGGPPTGAAGGALTGTYPNPGLATVTLGEGGTGQTAQQAAINALTGTQSAGTYLRSNGTDASLSAIQAADLPAATTSAQGALQLDGTAADIAAGGTQSAGTGSLVPRSTHVHPENTPFIASDAGFLAWNFDPIFATSAAAPGSGTVVLMRLQVRAAVTCTNVVMASAAAGSGLTTAENYAGLFASSGTLVGSSADQTTNWETAGELVMPLAGGPYLLSAGFYWVGFVWNGSVGPTFAKQPTATTAAMVNPGLTASTARVAYYSGATVHTLASITPANNVLYSAPYWVAIS